MSTALRVHPITGAEILPLGVINGRTIWPIMGASEAVAEAQAATTGATTQQGAVEQAGTASTNAQEWDGKVESLPQGVQDLIKNIRAENAEKRVAAKNADKAAQQHLAAALKAFGIDVPNGEDPLKVAEQAAQTAQSERDTARAQARDMAAENVVWRNASSLGINAAAVTDSRAFERAIADLDPSANDFADKVKQAATKAAENNPALKAAPAAATKGGAEFRGGSGEGARKSTTLEEAVERKLNG